MKASVFDRGPISGRARVQLWRSDPEGLELPWYPGDRLVLEEDQVVENLITDVGLAWVADQIAPTPVLAALSHMALGTDGTPPQGGDTTLGAEIAASRVALSVPVAQSGASLTWSAFWDKGVATSPSVHEAADFNAVAVGDMIGRFAIGPFNKTDQHVILIERTVFFVRFE